MAVILGVTAIGAWAVATHRVSYEITHGLSMHPVYHQGDLVVLAKADSYDVGEITGYHAGIHGPVVLHRIIGGDASGFAFKRDNNQATDVDEPLLTRSLGGPRCTCRSLTLMSVAVARWWSVLLVFAALLGTVGVIYIARRDAPARAGAEIHRRYSQLLVAVESMASPPGKPIVNVNEFKNLARLAERYGLLILCWSRDRAGAHRGRRPSPDGGKSYATLHRLYT